MKQIKITVPACLLFVYLTVCSCTESRTVIPEERNENEILPDELAEKMNTFKGSYAFIFNVI